MLYERVIQAKRNLGLEEKLINDTLTKEEVVIGQDYIDNCDYLDEKATVEDILESGRMPEPESPNDLDCDTDLEDTVSTVSDEEVDKEVEDTLVNLSEYAEALTPTIEQKEESMDVLCKDPYSEDTSGRTYSEVQKFLDKYTEGNDIIQVLIKNLMAVVADIQYIKESNNQHEQWALDYVDALNELSVSL